MCSRQWPDVPPPSSVGHTGQQGPVWSWMSGHRGCGEGMARALRVRRGQCEGLSACLSLTP